jgi:hypothetical protein
MLGDAAANKQFPPNDHDFDPYFFHFHGFGQPGHEPPPPPINIAQFHPNKDLQRAMGWGDWPQPNEQPQEEAPKLTPHQCKSRSCTRKPRA